MYCIKRFVESGETNGFAKGANSEVLDLVSRHVSLSLSHHLCLAASLVDGPAHEIIRGEVGGENSPHSVESCSYWLGWSDRWSDCFPTLKENGRKNIFKHHCLVILEHNLSISGWKF
jgi:hypothetical protein